MYRIIYNAVTWTVSLYFVTHTKGQELIATAEGCFAIPEKGQMGDRVRHREWTFTDRETLSGMAQTIQDVLWWERVDRIHRKQARADRDFHRHSGLIYQKYTMVDEDGTRELTCEPDSTVARFLKFNMHHRMAQTKIRKAQKRAQEAS